MFAFAAARADTHRLTSSLARSALPTAPVRREAPRVRSQRRFR